MPNPATRKDRSAEVAALSAAQAGWATTVRYAVIMLVSRGVPWAVVLAVAGLIRQVLG